MPDVMHLSGDKDEVGDIMIDKFKVLVSREMFNVGNIAGDEIVDGNHPVAFRQQTVGKVGAEEACAARDDAGDGTGILRHWRVGLAVAPDFGEHFAQG